MSLIAGKELFKLIEQGVIDAKPENINASSIDITLGPKLLVEACDYGPIDITDKGQGLSFDEWLSSELLTGDPEKFLMYPGVCVLAHSVETFNLPNNISAEYKLKSTMARNFLEHLNAGWCDAGWHGSKLTLELKNMSQFHSLLLTPGMKIGQVVFFRHAEVPADQSYATKGQYNGDQSVQSGKRLK